MAGDSCLNTLGDTGSQLRSAFESRNAQVVGFDSLRSYVKSRGKVSAP